MNKKYPLRLPLCILATKCMVRLVPSKLTAGERTVHIRQPHATGHIREWCVSIAWIDRHKRMCTNQLSQSIDAILLGAMGLQDVRLPNGTEIAPHLKIRTELGLFAGVRPVKVYPNTPQRLADARSQEIDFVVLRESTEGLFAEREKGVILEDQEARDTLVITRQNCENSAPRAEHPTDDEGITQKLLDAPDPIFGVPES